NSSDMRWIGSGKGSNYGSCLDLFAPGVNITSAGIADDTDFLPMTGTSMATPHVAGVAALVLQNNPTATPASVAASIIGMARPNVVTSPGTNSPNRLLSSSFVSVDGQFKRSQPWTSAYSDATGWTDQSKWTTLQYPDLNGDGKSDVCSRAVGGLFC